MDEAGFLEDDAIIALREAQKNERVQIRSFVFVFLNLSHFVEG